MDKKRLFLIDGSSFVYRAYYALGELSTSSGQVTNATYGLTNMLFKLLREEKPQYLAVTFDLAAPTFRHLQFEQYKATRPPTPEALVEQIPLIKKIVRLFNFPIYEVEGFEADDVIGTIARKAVEESFEVYILTIDKDALQLVGPHIKILSPHKLETVVYDENKVEERYGVSPAKVVDILALAGDVSDNIPGVPGIGEKIAAELIQQFGTLENLLSNIEHVSGDRKRENLRNFSERALLGKKLILLDTNVPLAVNWEDCRVKEPDYPQLLRLFQQLEFRSLIPPILSHVKPKSLPSEIVRTRLDLQNLQKKIATTPQIVIHFKINGSLPRHSKIVGVAFSFSPQENYYLPLTHTGLDALTEFSPDVLYELASLLGDKKIRKYGHNLKEGKVALSFCGISLQGIFFDTLIAAYLLEPGRSGYDLPSLALEHLGWVLPVIPENFPHGKFIPWEELPLETAGQIAGSEAGAIFQLVEILQKLLREKELLPLFEKVEIPLVEVLAEMELTGVKIDTQFLHQMSEEIGGKIQVLEKEIYRLAGEKFNLNSPQQMAFILFERLQLPSIKKTKTGQSTDVEVLEMLAQTHELPGKVLEYRQLVKLKSTYIDALPPLIYSPTKRLHTCFHQAATATGRLSSSEPNLQNIPIRGELGKQIRKAFIPAENHFFLSADYSQIELLILAHLSQDGILINAFRQGEDIHTHTAMDIFGVQASEVTPEMRRQAKVVNFGIIYGLSAFGLSKELNISTEIAQNYINNYFFRYPGVRRYIDETIANARRQGYVTTMLGRRRYLPDINSKTRSSREFAERTAINTPIQGTAADMIKVAMINIYREFADRRLKSKMILQIHDELLFEVPAEELSIIEEIVRPKMEKALEICVPVRVDINVGSNWAETF